MEGQSHCGNVSNLITEYRQGGLQYVSVIVIPLRSTEPRIGIDSSVTPTVLLAFPGHAMYVCQVFHVPADSGTPSLLATKAFPLTSLLIAANLLHSLPASTTQASQLPKPTHLSAAGVCAHWPPYLPPPYQPTPLTMTAASGAQSPDLPVRVSPCMTQQRMCANAGLWPQLALC